MPRGVHRVAELIVCDVCLRECTLQYTGGPVWEAARRRRRVCGRARARVRGSEWGREGRRDRGTEGRHTSTAPG